MSEHYRHVCICGAVLGQCRCPGPKDDRIIAPCVCAQPGAALPMELGPKVDRVPGSAQ